MADEFKKQNEINSMVDMVRDSYYENSLKKVIRNRWSMKCGN
jgi:hypothetical protein